MDSFLDFLLQNELLKSNEPRGKNVEDTARQVANECIKWTEEGRCCHNCNVCPMNVGHYVSGKEAGLYHAEAVSDSLNRKRMVEQQQLQTIGNLIAVGIACLFFYTQCCV